MNTSKLSLLIIILIISVRVQAQSTVRDRQKEEVIEAQLGAIDSTMVQTFKDATIAMDNQKHELADSLYSIVYTKAPNFDVLLRRLGNLKVFWGKTNEGLALCEKSVEINRSAYNLSALANSYLIQDDPTNDVKAQSLLKETIKLPDGDDLDILAAYVQASFRLNDIVSAKEGVDLMKSKYPDEMLTYYFNSILLASEEKWKDAKKEILKAREKGLPQEDVDRFLDLGINSEINKINGMIYLGVIVGFWAFISIPCR